MLCRFAGVYMDKSLKERLLDSSEDILIEPSMRELQWTLARNGLMPA